MISRLMLSLRKAVDEQQNRWSLTASSTIGANAQSVMFFRSRMGPNGKGEDVPLDTYLESQVRIR